MHEETVFILLIIFAVPPIAIVTRIVCKSLVRIVCHSRDVSLKIKLAERGMEPWEIEQVVNAGRFEHNKRVVTPADHHVQTFGGFSNKPRRRWFGRRQDHQPLEGKKASV